MGVAAAETRLRASSREVAIFARQLAVLTRAGLPLTRSLELLADHSGHKELGQAVSETRRDVEGGTPLAQAVRHHPRVFSALFGNMVEAGEASGALDTMLVRLADLLEANRALSRKATAALVYPAAITAVAAAAIAVLMTVVIPTFESMFEGAGVALPLPTRTVISLADFLRERWWQLAIATLCLAGAGRRWYRTSSGRRTVDRLALRIPLAGDLWRKITVVRTLRTLGTLTGSGVPVVEGMRMAATMAGNRFVEEALMDARKGVVFGGTVAGSLEETDAFPKIATQMIAAGEESGALDEMLDRVSDLCEEEAQGALTTFLAAAEPVLTVALGLVVGGIIVSMYLPVFDMAATLGR